MNQDITPGDALALDAWPSPNRPEAFSVSMSLTHDGNTTPVVVSTDSQSVARMLRVLDALHPEPSGGPTCVGQTLSPRTGVTQALCVDLGVVAPFDPAGIPPKVRAALTAARRLGAAADALINSNVSDMSERAATLQGLVTVFETCLGKVELL